jgi:vacuolar-type H+-ATPase subunit E/Vma4
MGLAEIEKKIIDEAKSEASKISRAGKEEVCRIEAETRQKAQVLQEQIISQAKQKAEETKKEILVPARLLEKSKLLKEKQKILAEIFAEFPPLVREKKEIEVAKLLYG